jgi:hypothetical protein
MRHPETNHDGNHDSATAATRRMRSLVLAWHDEESGDELTIDVRGSERFLEGLRPLGFVPVGEGTHSSNNRSAASGVGDRARGPASKGAPARKDTEAGEHHVRWTVRLARPWKPKVR